MHMSQLLSRALVLMSLMLASLAAQETSAPPRPVPGLLRWNEDWSLLRDPSRREGELDPLKYIPLGRKENWFLTLGGEYRVEYEYYGQNNWGAGRQDPNGFALQRLMPYVDAHLGSRVRVFTQFKFNYVNGRLGGPRPQIDQDPADLHEAFVDVGLWSRKRVTLRVGRQELAYGGGMLINDAEGVNVRASYDGVKVLYEGERWKADLFAVRPVENRGGMFDNVADHRQTLWGLYAQRTGAPILNGQLDLYFFAQDNRRRVWQQGAGRELRYTAGARHNGRRGDLDWTSLIALQWGRHEASSIRAMGVATETGYTLRQLRHRPRLAVRADFATGDADPRDSRLGTFSVIVPRGAYWGKLFLLGPHNIYEIHPLVQWRPHARLALQADWIWFWRFRKADGIYGAASQLLRSGRPDLPRYIGNQGNVEARWTLNRYTSLTLNGALFRPGEFLVQSGPSRTVRYLNIGTSFRF